MKKANDFLELPSGTCFNGEGKRFVGSVPIKGFVDRGDGILITDLKRSGLDFAPVRGGGFCRPKEGRSELFADGFPYSISCYPKQDYLKIVDCGEFYDAPKHGSDHVGRLEKGFYYDDLHPADWKDTLHPTLHGYWGFDWACTYEKAEMFDPQNRFIRTAYPYGQYFFRVGQRFRFVNVPDEIEAGEYALDEETGRLFFKPAPGDEKSEFSLSVREHCFVLHDQENIIIENCDISMFTGDAIVLENCRGITIRNCRISNIGCRAIVVKNSFGVHIENCEITHIGDTPIEIVCGDRKTLTKAECRIDGCRIHDFAYWSKVYSPGVLLNGCGLSVCDCEIFDGPHTAVLYAGNEITISGNAIYDVLKETDDAGAVYAGRNPTYRGNVVRDNLFFRTDGVGSYTSGVYNDDLLSGTHIEHNVFWHINNAVLCGGGTDFVIRDNVFYKCNPALRIDNRGSNMTDQWRSTMLQFRNAFDEVFSSSTTAALYLSRYPEIGRWKEWFEQSELPVVRSDGLLEHNFCVGDWIYVSDWCVLDHHFVEQDTVFCKEDELLKQLPERFLRILKEQGELIE